MTDLGDIRKLMARAYAARDSGDVEGLVATFHPNAVFGLVGANTVLEVTGAVRGHPDIRARMSEFVQTFNFANRDIKSFVYDGTRAAIHSVIEVTFIPTNRVFTTDVLDLCTFADGKIIELMEFADTALIKDVIASAPRASEASTSKHGLAS
jgi:ketosteroid isomerase-like protein